VRKVQAAGKLFDAIATAARQGFITDAEIRLYLSGAAITL
jgi:hypothetical protein